MRRLYAFLVFVFIASVSFAQWDVYTCDTLPEDKWPDFWTAGDNYPGGEFSVTIEDVDEFKVLNYYHPNTIDPSGQKTSARKTYRMDFEENNGELTLVARVKGYGQAQYELDSIDTMIEIELRPQGSGFRDKMWITYVDTAGNYNPTVQLREAEEDENYEFGDDDWHTFRMTVVNGTESAAYKIYIDEDPTPVVEGTTAKDNTSNYTKFGDGGSATTGGYIDWIAWNISGAYAPGEGDALPETIYVDGRDDVSVGTILTRQLNIYPNPANGYVTVAGTMPGAELTVYDITGKQVVSQILNSSRERVDVENLAAGVYFLNVRSTEGILTEKLIVE